MVSLQYFNNMEMFRSRELDRTGPKCFKQSKDIAEIRKEELKFDIKKDCIKIQIEKLYENIYFRLSLGLAGECN